MDTTILVDQLFDEGKKLIESLDALGPGFKFPIALWIKYPYQNDWELLLGVPHLNTTGSKDTLKIIYNTIRKENIDLSLSNIRLEDTQSEICRDIRKTNIRTGLGMKKIHFFDQYVDGKSFPDAIIYRIR